MIMVVMTTMMMMMMTMMIMMKISMRYQAMTSPGCVVSSYRPVKLPEPVSYTHLTLPTIYSV